MTHRPTERASHRQELVGAVARDATRVGCAAEGLCVRICQGVESVMSMGLIAMWRSNVVGPSNYASKSTSLSRRASSRASDPKSASERTESRRHGLLMRRDGGEDFCGSSNASRDAGLGRRTGHADALAGPRLAGLPRVVRAEGHAAPSLPAVLSGLRGMAVTWIVT